jgi:carbonic anhydrase/acetyltransferase-like protein (isoleucine patch superfamily)
MLYPYQHYQPTLGERVLVAPSADVIGRCTIGDDSSVWFQTVVRGDVHSIHIGHRTSVQDGTIIHVTHHKLPDASDGHPTVVGDDVTIGHRVVLHGCTIENACLIGMGAIILDGARIGTQSIVGAGALVTMGKQFPARSLILGSPAKAVRPLTDTEVAELYASAQRYVAYKNEYLDHHIFQKPIK